MFTMQLLVWVAVVALAGAVAWLLWNRRARNAASSSHLVSADVASAPPVNRSHDTVVIPAAMPRMRGHVVPSVRRTASKPATREPALSLKNVAPQTMTTFKSWVSCFPPLSPAASRIWEEVQAAEPNAKRIAGIIVQDPVMTAQLLRMANSAASAQTQEVTSTEQAILLLGYDCVLALAMRDSLSGVKSLPPDGYDLELLVRHSVATGLFASVIARNTGRVDSAEAVTVGVMHDIGKLVINMSNAPLVRQLRDPKTSTAGELPLHKEERCFGGNHAIIGAVLATEWRLPRLLVNAIEFHHYPLASELNECENRDRELAATIFMANQLAKLTGFSGNDEEVDLLPPETVALLGLPASYETIAQDVLPEVLIRLKAFGYSPKT